MKHFFNEKGGIVLKISVIFVVALLLLSAIAIVYFTIKDQNIEFSEEVIEDATKVAEMELNKAFAVTEEYSFEERFEAIQSIGYTEPEEGQYSIFTFEKIYDEDIDYYVILKLKPHEQYKHLTRINVSVFDRENRALIVEKENVLTWKTEETNNNS
ncbi:MAG: hypothetical protein GX072_02065 [Lysinibacillus sp.]|nr:hypothetical protein [Lysinibacillus sp.]